MPETPSSPVRHRTGPYIRPPRLGRVKDELATRPELGTGSPPGSLASAGRAWRQGGSPGAVVAPITTRRDPSVSGHHVRPDTGMVRKRPPPPSRRFRHRL